jgi:pimeloyl-ACP methyl ester carboxylesterase
MLRKILIRSLLVLSACYLGICGYMYFAQESLIFHPEKMSKNEKIDFGFPIAELAIESFDETKLSGILCGSKIPDTKRAIFFLHGNAGNLHDQQQAAEFYTALGYDFFTFDYRGFGKSEGEIESEEQFFKDIQVMYKEMQTAYHADSITVIGYSVGTAAAAMIASKMNPKKLVLIAPYYSLVDMTKRRYPFIPTALLKYRFETGEYLKKVKSKVLLIHGDQDEVLPFECSQMLSKYLKNESKFLPIQGQGHDDFEQNNLFEEEIRAFLSLSVE